MKHWKQWSGFWALVGMGFVSMTLLAADPAVGRRRSIRPNPLKLVVPYAVGGSTDIAGRALATPLQEFLGQPVAVVNLPGPVAP